MLLLLFVAVFVVFTYTFLHEGGHALVGLASGATITGFSVSFLDLGAHVGMVGDLTPAETVANNVAGVALPLLVWFGFMLVVPKRANFALETVKTTGTLVFLNTLLAWVVLPLVYLGGQAPGDDVTNFLRNTGLHPLWVVGAALLIYLGGWRLYLAKIEGIRHEVELYRKVDRDIITPGVRKTLGMIAGVFALCGLVAFGANGFRLAAPRADPFQPPQGYEQVATIDLSQGALTRSAAYAFALDRPTRVGIYLLVQDIDSDYFDVRLLGPDGYDHLLIHAEGYTATRDRSQFEELLPPGPYQIALTDQPSQGTLSIYTMGTP